MKSLKYLALCLVAAFITTSCSNDENEPQAPARKGKAVKFEMSIAGVNTRTTTDASTRTTDWKVGDAVGIFVYEEGSLAYTNAKYQYDGTDWKCESNGIVVESGKTYKYYAYYPYQDGITTPTSVVLAAAQDQNSENGYDLSDVLAASNENGTTDPDNSLVTLTFKHMYAMVEVSLFGDKVTQDPSAVKLLNVKLGGTLNLETQSVTNSGELTEVTMKYLGLQKEARAYRAVVPAQSITTNTPLVAVYDVDAVGKDYQFTYSKDVPYIKGEYRIMEVKIGEANSGITIPSKNTTIDPWTPSTSLDGTGSYEEIVVRLIEKPGAVGSTLAKHSATATEGWYQYFKNEGYGIFSIVETLDTEWKKAVKMEIQGNESNSYWKTAISYVHAEPIDITTNQIYVLKAKIKTEGGTKAAITIRQKSDNSSLLCSASYDNLISYNDYATNKALKPTTMVTSTTTDGVWTDCTLYINFNLKSTTVGTIYLDPAITTGTGAYSGDAAMPVVCTSDDISKVDIRIYSTDKTKYSISISDVILEPYIAPVP